MSNCQRVASNYNSQNFECQWPLPSCEISSRWPRFAKRAVANGVLPPAMSASICSDSWLRHNAFRQPGLRTLQFFYNSAVAVGWVGDPVFTAHAICCSAQSWQMMLNLANIAKNHSFPINLPTFLTIVSCPNFVIFWNTNCDCWQNNLYWITCQINIQILQYSDLTERKTAQH